MPGSTPGKVASTGMKSDKTENEADTKHKAGGWQVSNQPGDRETLTNSASEKFPAHYERQLSSYYTSLAEGKSQ